ncbi:hypothetical protein ETAE_3029 [Edwardsiella piscicida]|uniref:Uncharacterized protein n=1 Tax=Edwardsiella piscicida TaxID=1263550 RepID=A0AAU8PN54_EDWPI|nr:hypothetical protein ETAE_3029 [Edwardsiella tarda EIB202]
MCALFSAISRCVDGPRCHIGVNGARGQAGTIKNAPSRGVTGRL